METVIKLTEINKIYRTDEVETQALENVNIEVKKGEFLSIMGPSGCGKSTLLNIMGLLDEPTSGTIELCGTVIDPKLPDNKLAELRGTVLHAMREADAFDNLLGQTQTLAAAYATIDERNLHVVQHVER